jgi:hypothetical protein
MGHDPSRARQGSSRHDCLSARAAAEAARTIEAVRSRAGGRFYVNEHGAVFTPVSGNEGGIDYVFCGTIDPMRWFPEPKVLY